MNYYKNQNFMDLVEDIIDLDPQMRFAAIVDLDGNIVEAIMKSGKTSLKSQKDQEHFCKQVAQRRSMRNEFDNSLGKVRYIHVEREKITQIVIYPKKYTIYFTMEPELSISKKISLINKIKKMIIDL